MKIKLLKKLLISAIVIFGFTNVNAQLFDFTGDLNNFDITGAASTDLSSGTTLLITAQDNRGNIYLQQKAVADGGYGVVAANFVALRIVVKNNTSLNRLSLRTTTGGTNNTVGAFQTISTGDTEFKEYIFPLTVGGDWTGTVENWRIFLGFNNTGVGNAETLEFDSIEFLTELPVEPEPVITILDIQQVGNVPVDVGETATFEITYKTDGSGSDITGNTWRIYQGAGLPNTPTFAPITYQQTNDATATTQVSFTWPAGYTSGTFDFRLFNANPKEDFDWAPAGDHTSKINNAGSLEPTEGYLGLDVNVDVVPPVIPFSEFVTNPDFEDPSGISHYTGSTSEMARSISTTEFQNGANSMELAFSQDASKINWLFTTANGVGIYDPAFNPETTIDVTMWVKKTTNYDRSVVITIRSKHYLMGDSPTSTKKPIASATTTPDTGGAWEQLSFQLITDDEVAFDEANLWIAVDWEDTDPNGTNALNGDLIYIDNIEVTITNGTLSTEKISKDDASLKLFPNPVRDILRIKSDNSRAISKIEIYSLLGKRVLSTEQTESINVSALSPGVYVSKIYGDNDAVSTKRFIKQ